MRPAVPHQFAQHRVRLAILRIGQGSLRTQAARRAPVFQLCKVAAGIGEHGRYIAEQARHRGRFGKFPVGAGIGRTHEPTEILARIDKVDRVAGGKADRAGETVAAVKSRGRSAQYLDRFDEAHIGISTAPGILRSETEALRAADTIDLDQHAIAADAADDEILVAGAPRGAKCRTEARGCAAHRHTRLVAHQILDIGGEFVGDLLRIDHGDGCRRLLQRDRRARRCDDDGGFRIRRSGVRSVRQSGPRASQCGCNRKGR